MLFSDRGDAGAPLTITRLGNYDLPARQRNTPSPHKGINSLNQERAESLRNRMDAVKTAFPDDLTHPTAALKEAISSLQYSARDTMSGRFGVNRYLEGMTEVRNEILTEASHVALHSDKVTANLKATRVASSSHKPIDWEEVSRSHPLVNFILDKISDDLREATRILIIAELKQMAKTHSKIIDRIKETNGIEIVHFGTGRVLLEMLNWNSSRDHDRKKLEGLATIWNHTFNPHIEQSRQKYDATQATIRLSKRQGCTGHIHSSLPPVTSDFFSIVIEPAFFEAALGSNRIRSRHHSLIELEIVGQDLMTALRGHPEGKPVPCSFRRIAGQHKKGVDRPLAQVTEDINDIDAKIKASPEGIALQEALDKMVSLANVKRSGQKWKAELEASILDFTEALSRASDRSSQEIQAGIQAVNHYVTDGAKQMLSEISGSLPDGTLQILGLPSE
jgi:hypothetical protein